MSSLNRSIYTERLMRVAPQIRTAGISGDYSEPTVGELCASYNFLGSVTPDKIHMFHHRGGDVGTAHRHWGLARDPAADADTRYGLKTKGDGDIDPCLRPDLHASRGSALLSASGDRRRERHPLGRTPAPSYDIPEPPAGFGVSTLKDGSVSALMNGWRNVDIRHAPGASMNRGYNWEAAGIDTRQHRFGRATPHGEDSTAAGMRTLAGRPGLTLVPKVVKEFHLTKDAVLGQSRRYGFTDPAAPKGEETQRRVTAGAAVQRGRAANGFQVEQPTVKELLSSWAVHQGGGGGGGGRWFRRGWLSPRLRARRLRQGAGEVSYRGDGLPATAKARRRGHRGSASVPFPLCDPGCGLGELRGRSGAGRYPGSVSQMQFRLDRSPDPAGVLSYRG
ncbi:unnamed protein product [Phytomonas sp. EM1]|nr:unnamed protein product [Phytomonas sp. EM1]|eukprot:CCW65655.1 unnamed protein product [Phytomonas sp. isolate EM1]